MSRLLYGKASVCDLRPRRSAEIADLRHLIRRQELQGPIPLYLIFLCIFIVFLFFCLATLTVTLLCLILLSSRDIVSFFLTPSLPLQHSLPPLRLLHSLSILSSFSFLCFLSCLSFFLSHSSLSSFYHILLFLASIPSCHSFFPPYPIFLTVPRPPL